MKKEHEETILSLLTAWQLPWKESEGGLYWRSEERGMELELSEADFPDQLPGHDHFVLEALWCRGYGWDSFPIFRMDLTRAQAMELGWFQPTPVSAKAAEWMSAEHRWQRECETPLLEKYRVFRLDDLPLEGWREWAELVRLHDDIAPPGTENEIPSGIPNEAELFALTGRRPHPHREKRITNGTIN